MEMRRGKEREEIEAGRGSNQDMGKTTVGAEVEGTLAELEFFKSENKKLQILLPTYPSF